MKWSTEFLPEARNDLKKLSGNQRSIVAKAITRVEKNPLPRSEGGYGISLGHKGTYNLTNYLEIKLRGAGIRVIYKLIRTETEMLVVVIGMREDEDVYEVAQQRIEKHNLNDF
ncbi:MAG: type II toxin-antitoxin system RelE/ParE family toxin [Synergistaceae bacterium]|nr:type II toxin-antitoxin system RelE/ParE family toxin [Synergistaceae bacterium]MBR0252542.1 type II toxin-antitoxin system RelE/ParE family toxin [Synergistaceae bacterium]MBR0315718.1 type II toxin-antitoxin system RelE/ParE family toxin [Synergistaceae bacterium]